MRTRRILTSLIGLLLALGLAACGPDEEPENNENNEPDGGVQDAGDAGDADDGGQEDADDGGQEDADDGGQEDGGDADDDGGGDMPEPNPDAADQIQDIVDGETGAIDEAAVTYVREEHGIDAAGFFLQATPEGPALFVVAEDEDVEVGDIVSLEVTEVNDEADGRTEATDYEGLSVEESGYDVEELVQEVSETDDLVTNLDDYSQELISADVEAVGSFGFAGDGHQSAQIETDGVFDEENFELRVTSAIYEDLALDEGCALAVGPTPLWRYQDTAQVSAWSLDDIEGGFCEDPTGFEEAVATAEDEVRVEFSRLLDEESLDEDGDQFMTDPELDISGAEVDGNVVTLTTESQEVGEEYTLSLDDSADQPLQDRLGMDVGEEDETTTFFGYEEPAEVVINEINSQISGNCDLLEIRVTEGGSMNGFSFIERDDPLVNFGEGFSVETDDIVVIHFRSEDENCNPDGASMEVEATDEEAEADFGGNFDDAYDWWTDETTLTDTDNVLRVEDATGEIVDAVFLVDDEGGCEDYDAANPTEDAAEVVADADEWETPDGEVPDDGFVGQDFCENAVGGFAETSDDAGGTSLQRDGDTDNNNLEDWTDQNDSSWGALNEGQGN